MNKYSIYRDICAIIMATILFTNGLRINTWQFWAVYLSAWAMVIIQYMEDTNE